MNASRWLEGLGSLYRGLLRLYPAPFQQRFGAEMTQVFDTLCRQEYTAAGVDGALQLGLLALADGLHSVVQQWWIRIFQRRPAMEITSSDLHSGVSPLSPFQAGLAGLPFAAFGLANIVERLLPFPVIAAPPGLLGLAQVVLRSPYLWFGILCLTGLGIGLAKGFPRWTASYLGWSVLFCWWWWNLAANAERWDEKIWRALPGVVLLAMLLLAALLRHSWRPLRDMLRSLWQDWTLASFAVFTFFAFIFMVYDENHHPLLLLFIGASALIASAGAWAYFRLKSSIPRALTLAASLLVLAVLSTWSYATWDYRAYYNLPAGPTVEWQTMWTTLVVALVMLVPALAAWLRRRTHRATPG